MMLLLFMLKEVLTDFTNLSEEEKDKKREYENKRYHNMSKEKKQELKKNMKKKLPWG